MGGPDFVDQLLTSLRVISMLKEGQKLRVRNGLLGIEFKSTGIPTAINRWVHNDNRYTSLMYIKNVVNNSMEISRTHSKDRINTALTDSLTGLGALSVTYGSDVSVAAMIHVLQERIKNHVQSDHIPLENARE
jgi:hypothetical protein